MAIGHRAEDILHALRESGAPAELVAFDVALLELQAGVAGTVTPPGLTVAEVHAHIAQGVPLLSKSFVQCLLSAPAFRRLANRLAHLLRARRPDLGSTLDSGLDTRDPAVLTFLVTHTRRAFLRPVACALAPLLEDGLWGRSKCPVCGGAPDMAGLHDEHGGRHLLCSRCDAEWPYRRIGCPFCEADVPGDLSYHLARNGDYRLYVCARCGRYLKTVDRRRRVGVCLPAERVLTAGLDAAAAHLRSRSMEPARAGE